MRRVRCHIVSRSRHGGRCLSWQAVGVIPDRRVSVRAQRTPGISGRDGHARAWRWEIASLWLQFAVPGVWFRGSHGVRCEATVGGLVVWWFGGVVVWWFGGLVVWWFGGLVQSSLG
jgi:hypothetical protein